MAGRQDRLALVLRIRSLRSFFLPPPNLTGTYSQAEYDRTAAFLLISHAEIEEFIEQRCLEIVDSVVDAWILDAKPRSTIVALAAFSHSDGENAVPKPDDTGPPKIRTVVREEKRSYSKAVNNNHGIKSENLLRLLIPVGIRESQLPTQFLADMNAFGASRGKLAHNRIAANNRPDPKDSRRLLTRLVLELRRLDQKLLALKGEA